MEVFFKHTMIEPWFFYVFRSNIAALAMSRPVASVRPMMSNPPPIIRTVHPRPGGGATSSLPISSLLRPGVSVHQVKTTTGRWRYKAQDNKTMVLKYADSTLEGKD